MLNWNAINFKPCYEQKYGPMASNLSKDNTERKVFNRYFQFFFRNNMSSLVISTS